MKQTVVRGAAALALGVSLLAAGACGRAFMNVGKVIEGVSPDSIAMEVILIGDAGLPAPGGEPVLKALTRTASWDPRRTFVVYLGDNVYPTGVPDTAGATRREAERILKAQVQAVLDAGSKGIFVPGNHDWEAGAAGGWPAIIRQAQLIREYAGDDMTVLPQRGCPGPEVLDLGERVRIIALDTQWWLHTGPKPDREDEGCRPYTRAGVLDSIRTVLRTAGQRHAVVVAHHPLVSGGEHGGYFDWPTYLFPFHPWARQGGLFADQDITGVEYQRMIASLGAAFRDHPPLVYAAGHEHNLQVFRRGPSRYHLVSGSGVYGHTTAVRAITGTQYTRRASGFMRLAFLVDGRVRLAVEVVDAKGDTREDFSTWLQPVLRSRDTTRAPGAPRATTGTGSGR